MSALQRLRSLCVFSGRLLSAKSGPEMHLSFTQVHGGAALQILCDEAGLDALIAKLVEARDAGHLHLRSPSLNDSDPWGGAAIGEVIITTLPD